MSDNQPNKTKQNKNSNKNGNKNPILKLLDTDYEKKKMLTYVHKAKMQCNRFGRESQRNCRPENWMGASSLKK